MSRARIYAQSLMSIKCVNADGADSFEINSIEHEAPDWKQYWDDTSGQLLDPDLTRAARMDEVECIQSMKVYSKVPISQCVKETGKRSIGTRWIDVNKGDKAHPKHRSRLVAQELATHKQPELFAATPPIEYVRYLVSRCASSQWCNKRTCLMIQDVKKAYFFAKATRRVYVALPWEDTNPGEE